MKINVFPLFFLHSSLFTIRSPSFTPMNPLLLKELRQLVRNRFIIVLINLFIAVMVVACMTATLFQQTSPLYEGSGTRLFVTLTSFLSFACFLAVVVYTAKSTANERINDDLMLTSAMRPSTIIIGKVLSGAVLTLLLMSITAPFVMLAYLLRGLDMETVAVSIRSVI